MNGMSRREISPLKIQVSNLEELVFLASSTHSSVIHLDEERKIAFSFLMPFASIIPVIYFCKLDKLPEAKFAHANRITGKVRFSNELSAEPNETSILIVKIKSEDKLFDDELEK